MPLDSSIVRDSYYRERISSWSVESRAALTVRLALRWKLIQAVPAVTADTSSNHQDFIRG